MGGSAGGLRSIPNRATRTRTSKRERPRWQTKSTSSDRNDAGLEPDERPLARKAVGRRNLPGGHMWRLAFEAPPNALASRLRYSDVASASHCPAPVDFTVQLNVLLASGAALPVAMVQRIFPLPVKPVTLPSVIVSAIFLSVS
jgi:hypothetical protein